MIKEILASDYLLTAQDLAMQHWREVAEVTGVPEPNINPTLIAALQQAGALLTLGAFDGDHLVGYSINIMGPTFNFQTLRVCQNEGIFVDRQHRGALGVRLIHATIEAAAAKGCARVEMHAYRGTAADMLLSRLRHRGRPFQAYDIIHTMEIEPCPPESL